MDRITIGYLTEFSKSFGFDNEKDITVQFEHFVNYSIIEHKVDEHFDVENLNIGTDSTIGVDGFAIILNKKIISNEEELLDILLHQSDVSAEVIFIQSKTSKSFETKNIGNFGWAVSDFISENPKLKWPESAKYRISLFNTLYKHITKLRDKPSCSLYYVSLGTLKSDENIAAKIDSIISDISSENLFSRLNFELYGANDIHKAYKGIGLSINKSFEFPMRITLPEIDRVEESYLGIVQASTINYLITDDNGDILNNVFYDNVRDYQGENKVNREISTTLNSEYKDAFQILNNGITIVTQKLQTTRNTITISNYQIINGCQTSNVIHQNISSIDDNVYVPLKLISSTDIEITSKLIRSTNRQTEVKDQDLIAFSNFQKTLEDFYKTFSGDDLLYYERRSKQYSKSPIEKKRVIDKTTQIKLIASIFFDRPEIATRFFGTLFKTFGDQLFQDDQKPIAYYTAALCYFKLEEAFRRGDIDKRFKKIKFFLLMMLRYEISNSSLPYLNSNKMDVYCDLILSNIKNDSILKEILNKIVRKIESLGLDLDDRELSKSRTFTTQCLSFYNKRM